MEEIRHVVLLDVSSLIVPHRETVSQGRRSVGVRAGNKASGLPVCGRRYPTDPAEYDFLVVGSTVMHYKPKNTCTAIGEGRVLLTRPYMWSGINRASVAR